MSGYGGYPARPPGLYPIRRGIVDFSGVPERHEELLEELARNVADPFVGLTDDGHPRPELYPLEPSDLDTTDAAVAARAFLHALSPDQHQRARLPIESEQFRAWINAFPPQQPHGVLLEDLDFHQRDLAMNVLEELLSDRGFQQVRDMMRINAALADVAGAYEDTLREYLYWFAIFGEPEAGSPWGAQMFGHHSCLQIFVYDGHITVGPQFLGAEPRVVLDGPLAGIRAFDEELALGVDLMAGLATPLQQRALLAASMVRAELPPELAHPTEGRMRGSAAKDNAVVPYEGVSGADMDAASRERLVALLSCYVGRLPEGHAQRRLEQVLEHLDDTWFTWAGDVGVDRPFYYKVHSPVIFIELDAHAGIFIANDEAEPFHIHNIVRVPNGNDYGRAYLTAIRAGASEPAARAS